MTELPTLPDLPWGWIGLLTVLVLWMLGAYNRIVALRGAVAAAWQQLDAVLKDRQQAIGALLEAVTDQLAGERATLDALVAAQVQVATAAEVLRKKPTREEPTAVLSHAEALIGSSLTRLLALIDHHPELRHDEAVRPQLRALAAAGPAAEFARKAFNEAAGRYNAAIEQFPTRLLNRFFRFERAGVL